MFEAGCISSDWFGFHSCLLKLWAAASPDQVSQDSAHLLTQEPEEAQEPRVIPTDAV